MKWAIAVVVLMFGLILLGFVHYFMNVPIENISYVMTGHYSNQTTWYFDVGVVVTAGGGLLALCGSRK